MDDHNHPEPQLPAVMPQPVPTSFSIAQVVDNRTGNILAQIVINTPTGSHVVFVDAASAVGLGKALQKIGEVSATGLIVP